MLKILLQRLGYHELYPLPPTIDAVWITTWQGDLTLAPLSPSQLDRAHRVFYVEAAK